MSSAIGLVCFDPEKRRELELLAGEAGYEARSVSQLHETAELLKEFRPRLMLLTDSRVEDAARLLRSLSAAEPLLPVAVAMTRRDASRAVELMRAGATEVIPPPWTRESVEACLAKSLRASGTSVSLRPRPRRKKGPYYLFALLLFWGAALGVLSVRRAHRLKALAAARTYHWNLPYRHPSGMAFHDGQLWIADWYDQSLYVHSAASLGIERLIHFPDQTPISLVFARGYLWTLDASGLIERRELDAKLTVLQKYRAAAPGTVSMAFDGLYLWTLDQRHVLHKHLMDIDLSELASYRCPDPDPTAVAYDGKTLWVLDAADRDLVRLNLERPDQALGAVPLPEYAGGVWRPAALGWDGRRFWTVGENLSKGGGPARLFEHRPANP